MPKDEHSANPFFQTVMFDVPQMCLNITYEHWGIRYFNHTTWMSPAIVHKYLKEYILV